MTYTVKPPSDLAEQGGAKFRVSSEPVDDTGIDAQRWKNRARAAGQGALFGFADEAVAALRALGPETYREAVTSEREALEQYQKEHPIEATGLEIAGGLTTGLAGLGRSAARTAGRSLLRRVGEGAAVGATGGGVYGMGTAEGNPLQRLFSHDARMGSAFGAATGGILPALGSIKRVIWPNVRREAEDVVLQAVRQADETPEQLARRARETGRELTLAELGEPTRDLLKIHEATARGRGDVRQWLKNRPRNARERITKDFEELLGPQTKYWDEWRALDQARKNAARPAYQQLFRQSGTVGTPELNNLLLNSTDVQKALRKAPDVAMRWDNIKLPRIINKKGQVTRSPTMQEWDYTKRALDELISAQRDPVTGKLSAEGAGLSALRGRLVSELDDATNGAYRRARQLYSGPTKLMEAMQLGRKAVSTQDLELLQDTVATLGPGETEAFRSGVLTGLQQSMNRPASELTRVRQWAQSPEARQRLRLAFSDDDTFQRFMQRMETELDLASTSAAIHGSDTARRMAGARQSAIRVGLPLSPNEFSRRLGREVAGAGAAEMEERMAGEIMDILTDRDPLRAALRARGHLNPTRTEQLERFLSPAGPALRASILRNLGIVGGEPPVREEEVSSQPVAEIR